MGYAYFSLEAYKSKHDSIRIQKNRLKAYYNSPQHFCKSLFENRLAQNGYKLLEPKPKNSIEARLDTCIYNMGEYAIITGLKDRKFKIRYYSNTKNQPKDLTLFKGTAGIKSEIIFDRDTCILRKDGTVPDNSIIFGLSMGLKKVGGMLPDNYQPGK